MSSLAEDIAGSPPLHLDDETMARAQSALKTMTALFHEAMDDEVSALSAARSALRASRPTQDLVGKLGAQAEILKSNGGRFENPLLSALAGSLQNLVASTPEPELLPLDLVDAHVDAVRALARPAALADPRSAELVRSLRTSVRRTVDGWKQTATAA